MALNSHKPTKPFIPLAITRSGRTFFGIKPPFQPCKITNRKMRRLWGK